MSQGARGSSRPNYNAGLPWHDVDGLDRTVELLVQLNFDACLLVPLLPHVQSQSLLLLNIPHDMCILQGKASLISRNSMQQVSWRLVALHGTPCQSARRAHLGFVHEHGLGLLVHRKVYSMRRPASPPPLHQCNPRSRRRTKAAVTRM